MPFAERLQKILARGGIASRRAAESLITEGRVRVNGQVVTELGAKADPRRDRIEVDGKRVVAEHPVYYALHKPRGFVTTLSDPEGRPSIRELLRTHGITERVFPVGRLDFHTSGLLLLTNDGEFSDGLLHPKRKVPKTYVVKVQGVMEPKDIDKWRAGVELEDGKTLPADAAFLRFEGDKTWFEITIREGRNQQIRRMGDATGFRVMRLSRVAFAGIRADGLRPGAVRPLTYEELVELKKAYEVPRRPNVAKGMEAPASPKRGAAHVARRLASHDLERSEAGGAPSGDRGKGRATTDRRNPAASHARSTQGGGVSDRRPSPPRRDRADDRSTPRDGGKSPAAPRSRGRAFERPRRG